LPQQWKESVVLPINIKDDKVKVNLSQCLTKHHANEDVSCA